MSIKRYRIVMTFPDLVAAHAEQEVRVESTHWTTAIKLACNEVSKRPHVAGKHIKSAKFQLAIIDSEVVVQPATQKQPLSATP